MTKRAFSVTAEFCPSVQKVVVVYQVRHGVPDSVRRDAHELPAGVDLEGADLGHRGDDLLPRRLVDLALEKEVAEGTGRDEDAAHSETERLRLSIETARYGCN